MGHRHIFRSIATTIALSLAVSAVAVTSTSAATRPAAPSAKTGGEVTVAINETFAGFCYTALVAGTALNGMSTIFESLFLKSKTGIRLVYLQVGQRQRLTSKRGPSHCVREFHTQTGKPSMLTQPWKT